MRRALAVLLLVPALGAVSLADASAACSSQGTWVKNSVTLVLEYQVAQGCQEKATPTSPPAGGHSAPACDLGSAAPATFCWGSTPCYYRSSVVPYAPPEGLAPGAKWQVRLCLTNGIWLGTAEAIGQALPPPTLLDQSREAIGQIVLPEPQLVFNPTNRTLVNLDTRFWAAGLEPKALVGTSAFGLVAYATPKRLAVTPGDGSAPFTCGWVTSKSPACHYAYRHSSVGGSAVGRNGAPAYEATAKAVWTVTFKNKDGPVTIAGAPTEVVSAAKVARVVVVEVQTIVTSVG